MLNKNNSLKHIINHTTPDLLHQIIKSPNKSRVIWGKEMRLQTRVLIKSNKLLGLDFSVGQNVMNSTQRFFSFSLGKARQVDYLLDHLSGRKVQTGNLS